MIQQVTHMVIHVHLGTIITQVTVVKVQTVHIMMMTLTLLFSAVFVKMVVTMINQMAMIL